MTVVRSIIIFLLGILLGVLLCIGRARALSVDWKQDRWTVTIWANSGNFFEPKLMDIVVGLRSDGVLVWKDK